MDRFWHSPVNAVTKMRRGILRLLLVVLLAAIFAYLASFPPASSHPPAIGLVSIEPAGMFDDSGKEMRLVTLAVRNDSPKNRGNPDRNTLYVADSARGLEVRVAKAWKQVGWATNLWGFETRLDPGNQNQSGLALIPGAEDRCRIWIKYAVPTLSSKGLLEFAVTRLPMSARSRISYKFWRWVGFPGVYRPGHWREICVEVPLAASSGEPEVNWTR
jgi:hypothetical protein